MSGVTLRMVFHTGGRNLTVTLRNVRADVTGAEVGNVMDAITGNRGMFPVSPMESIGAELIHRTAVDLD